MTDRRPVTDLPRPLYWKLLISFVGGMVTMLIFAGLITAEILFGVNIGWLMVTGFIPVCLLLWWLDLQDEAREKLQSTDED